MIPHLAGSPFVEVGEVLARNRRNFRVTREVGLRPWQGSILQASTLRNPSTDFAGVCGVEKHGSTDAVVHSSCPFPSGSHRRWHRIFIYGMYLVGLGARSRRVFPDAMSSPFQAHLEMIVGDPLAATPRNAWVNGWFLGVLGAGIDEYQLRMG